MQKKWIVSAVCSVTLVMTMEACSSNSKSNTGSNTTASGNGSPNGSTSAGQAKTTSDPIKVGVICTCSGSLGATIGPGEKVYRAWVDSVNASGGIDGHPVQLILQDDVGVPGTSITDFQTLASDHVDAVVDSTIADAGWANTAAASGIPVVGLLPYSPSFYTSPDFYGEGTTLDAGNLAAVVTAKDAGASNFGDLYSRGGGGL